MSDSEKGIWNGGKTFENKYEKLIRESKTIDTIFQSEKIEKTLKIIKELKTYHELYDTEKEK